MRAVKHVHVAHALVFFADEPPFGAFKLHLAGGGPVAAHLVFDPRHLHAVGGPVRQELGHQKQGNAPRALGGRCGRGRVGEARQDTVHDVVGEVVVPAANENLGARDAVASVVVTVGLGDHLAQV